MSRPPIKAMEAVKRYCEKKNMCNGCPLRTLDKYGYRSCADHPEKWIILKEGDRNEHD